ncbi:MAG: hypothetical protein GY772_19195 [bacterium]|nr:hypothetical protein [bacterium]
MQRHNQLHQRHQLLLHQPAEQLLLQPAAAQLQRHLRPEARPRLPAPLALWRVVARAPLQLAVGRGGEVAAQSAAAAFPRRRLAAAAAAKAWARVALLQPKLAAAAAVVARPLRR